MKTTSKTTVIKMLAPVVIHDDLASAVLNQQWTALKENAAFLVKMVMAEKGILTQVLHWMIQQPTVGLNDILHVLDDLQDQPLNEWHAAGTTMTTPTLLQRAISCNRIDVMQALIARGAQLYHNMECPKEVHPLLLALHPAVNEGTFETLIRYYALPNHCNGFAKYMEDDRFSFYVPISYGRLTALKATGLDIRMSHCAWLCADVPALEMCDVDLTDVAQLTRYLMHYIGMHNEVLAVHLARQFVFPTNNPELAAAVLQSDFFELVKTLIVTLKLDQPQVANGKSAMLIAAENNAPESCRALMEADIDGDVEGISRSFFSISRPVTAYTAALERNKTLAEELARYNEQRKAKQEKK